MPPHICRSPDAHLIPKCSTHGRDAQAAGLTRVQLKAARAERERQLEVLAIARLRATVEQMKQMDSVTKAAEAHVSTLDQLMSCTHVIESTLRQTAQRQAAAELAATPSPTIVCLMNATALLCR